MLPWSILHDKPADLLVPGIALLGLTVVFLVQIKNPNFEDGKALWIALVTVICGTVIATASGADPSRAAVYFAGVAIAGPLAAFCIRRVSSIARRKDDAGDRATP